jgi:hypothetical protein
MITFAHFKSLIQQSLDHSGNSRNDLEAYHRALWKLIVAKRDTQPSWTLFLEFLTQALTDEPLDFNPNWLDVSKDGHQIEYEMQTKLSDFDFLSQTIRFQIAELRRMRDAGYYQRDPNTLYMGVNSPTGNTWYNLFPDSYLTCAIAGYFNQTSDEMSLEEATWRELAVFLIYGRLYE